MPLARLFLKPRVRKNRPPLPILLPLLIGATFLAGAAILAQPTLQFLVKAEHAEARYIGAIADHPRFRFTAADGTIVSFTARTGSAKGRHEGDSATIWYDPSHPADARLIGGHEQWKGSLALGAVGLLSLGIGAVLVRAWRKRQTNGIGSSSPS